QHSHNRIRQHPGQIQDEPGRLPLSPENQKRSGPKSQRHKGSHCHQQRRVQIDPHSLPSSLFLNTVSSTVITAIAGIIKESGPNTSRQAREAPTPIRALKWLRQLLHCSVNTTTNRAVMAKSTPEVSTVSTLPTQAPRTLPMIQ